MRAKLPDRRLSVTTMVTHEIAGGQCIKALVTFGFDTVETKERYGVRELFCADFKAGSDNQALIMDACVLISRLLQHGYRPQELSAALCDPPSLLGSILRKAVQIDNDWSSGLRK